MRPCLHCGAVCLGDTTVNPKQFLWVGPPELWFLPTPLLCQFPLGLFCPNVFCLQRGLCEQLASSGEAGEEVGGAGDEQGPFPSQAIGACCMFGVEGDIP